MKFLAAALYILGKIAILRIMECEKQMHISEQKSVFLTNGSHSQFIAINHNMSNLSCKQHSKKKWEFNC